MNAKDQKHFREIKARLKDLEENHGDDIREGKLLRMSTVVITESLWLARQLDLEMRGRQVEDEVEEAAAN